MKACPTGFIYAYRMKAPPAGDGSARECLSGHCFRGFRGLFYFQSGSISKFMKGAYLQSVEGLQRWLQGHGLKITAVLAALLIINSAAIWGIVSSRRSAESLALQDMRLQTTAHARSLEAVLASRRADFTFLSRSSPLAEAPASLAISNPVSRRWGKLDIEGSLLLFVAAHPEVDLLIIRDAQSRPLVVAGRREGAPVLLRVQDYSQVTVERTGHLSGSWPLVSSSKARGTLEAVLDVADLLKVASPGIGPQFELIQQQSQSSDEVKAPITVAVSIPVNDEAWPSPVHWQLVCRRNPSRLIASVTLLANRYRAAVIANLVVMIVTALLALAALRQTRISALLEAENRQHARVRELERQLMHNERLASVGRLAAGMAHEINNPLEGMSNYLSLLENDLKADRTAEVVEMAAHVREGLERVAGIIRQVLDYSDPGVMPHASLNLNEVLDETVRFVRSNPAFRQVAVVFRSPDSEIQILGNRVTLGQLFLNLLMNACQVQPDGGQIDIASFKDGEKANVFVGDCGPGIAPDALPRIFEPFFSTRGSTGLGLSLCHGIVEEHGGRIQATNRSEGGAIFCIELPLQRHGLLETERFLPVAGESMNKEQLV